MSVAVLMVCASLIDTLDECLHLAHQAEERRFLAEDDDDQERLARIVACDAYDADDYQVAIQMASTLPCAASPGQRLQLLLPSGK